MRFTHGPRQKLNILLKSTMKGYKRFGTVIRNQRKEEEKPPLKITSPSSFKKRARASHWF
jgi:hypothetical protein